MPIAIDHQLREQINHNASDFPITYFHDELFALPNRAGPVHWHPDFEIVTAECSAVDVQVGQKHLTLEAGDSIFINGNILHGIRQVSGDVPDPLPNIVFSDSIFAPGTSVIYQKYIRPIAGSDALPFIVFRHGNSWHDAVTRLAEEIYGQLRERGACYEMIVQRDLNHIFEYLFRHYDDLPKSEATRVQIYTQIRIQKMLTHIYTHYAEPVTLDDIARAADVSRSEAGRCFHAYLGCSPIDALIRYRLQTACRLLSDTNLTLQEISHACGFNSVNYFSRQFRRTYGYAPGQNRNLGK